MVRRLFGLMLSETAVFSGVELTVNWAFSGLARRIATNNRRSQILFAMPYVFYGGKNTGISKVLRYHNQGNIFEAAPYFWGVHP